VVSIRDFTKENAPPQPEPQPRPAPRSSNGGSNGEGVFARLKEVAEWPDIMGPHPDAIEVTDHGDSAILYAWRHPNNTNPISAKVLKAAPYALINWSENFLSLPVGADQNLDMPKVYAELNYGGNLSAASKALSHGDAVNLPQHVIDACRSVGYQQPRWTGAGPPSSAFLLSGKQSQSEGSADGDQDQQASEQGDEQAGEQPERSTWRPVDLTAVLDGTWRPPEPSVGRRSDDNGVFYPGKTHTVVSETEAGKTWFALAACKSEMEDGCHVFYIDFEDDEGSVADRLLALGADPEVIREQFHYFRPEHPLEGRHLEALLEELDAHRPSLALVDGVTEAMTLHALNPNDNVDIALFDKRVAQPLTITGAAQVSFDHVTKDKDGRGRYAIGGVHKLTSFLARATPLRAVSPSASDGQADAPSG
jgi:hypothetical protein